ncbi:MAG: MBOAT family protein [Ignavibacteria bacterium]|jgi:alginate O-acetyltransferase complex protein AlgI|nr:MBOAT family protein [Ignavibacteria bacterium]
MLFNSLEFAIFLPTVFLLYWFVFNKSIRLQNAFIVVASYFFYACWDWRFLFLIALTSVSSWYSGYLIKYFSNSSHKKSNNKKEKSVLICNIVLNISILVFFKYYNFFTESFASFFTLFGKELNISTLNIILPVGISFYTFQAIGYSIDVYKGKITATDDIIAFLAFVSFFPQLVAGPIERATNLLPQFYRQRTFNYNESVDGLRQILWGLFKKIVVADNCAITVNQVFSSYQEQTGFMLASAAIFFAFQIYCDFSGYSDIAIGTAKLFNFKLMRNFNLPYFSRDVAEFWRRWHISLTTWFRDYIYIPLGGSRVNRYKTVANTFIVFIVSGFWHGANWTFILWGVYHALLFLPLILLNKNRKHLNNVAENRLLPSTKELIQMIFTFILVTIGWIIFRAENMPQAITYISNIFNASLFTVPSYGKMQYLINISAIAFLIIIEWLQRNKQHSLEIKGTGLFKHRAPRFALYYFLVVCIFYFIGEEKVFIYFQF